MPQHALSPAQGVIVAVLGQLNREATTDLCRVQQSQGVDVLG